MSPELTSHESATGVILAGGRGLRVGGMDKGLIEWRGRPLIEYGLDCLRAQTSTLLISANRNLERYRAYGVPVLSDDAPGYPGPLAGMLAAARAADTPWIVCAPCDMPQLPADAVRRLLAAAREQQVCAAYAVCRGDALYPLCVFERALIASLHEAATSNDRSVRGFLQRNNAARADFSDCGLRNLNTPQALEAA